MALNIAILFCLLMLGIALYHEPRILNPVFIFFGEWFLVLFLSKLNLYDILSVSNRTYNLILVGLVVFAIGFYSYNFLNIKTSSLSKVVKFELNEKLVYTLAIITMIFFFGDFLKSAGSLLGGGSLANLRVNAQEGALFSGNKLMNAIRILITAPFSLVLSVIVPANFFSQKKHSKKKKGLLILTVIILLERLLSDGGRSPIVYLMMGFAICYSFLQENVTKIKKKKIIKDWKIRLPKNFYKIFLIVAGSFAVLYWITLSRSGENTVRYSYYYFAMEPVMFEKWASIVDGRGLIAYGMTSANGLLFALFYVLSSVLGIPYPEYWRSIYDVIESLGTQWQIITTNGLTANSYASIFWTFYFDGRIWGIVIGMLIYGFFVAYAYRKAIKSPSERNVAIYSFVLIGVFYTFQELIFQNIYYTISFIMLIFFLYKKKN